MARWFSRAPATPPEVIERVEAVEIPIITETKRRLARGEYEDALRAAYSQVVADIQRAYGAQFPPGWTHDELIERGLDGRTGHLPEFLRRLTDLYVPVRFGSVPVPKDLDQLSGLLVSIYAQRPMWQLYLQPRREDGAGTRAAPRTSAAALVHAPRESP
ncbi:MAG TPA: DUF4129 domain-containing protein [Thermoplasmata archaeon]|nr:DUF4129 domain-containing protein [Thermoplasmata archaeon]